MGLAYKNQSFQDRITQQWVILFGKRITKANHDWLLGPFGGVNGIGQKFIHQLAQKEGLFIAEENETKGLFQSIKQLNLPEKELEKLSKEIVHFYENTSKYRLSLKVKWNPLFKIFGILLKIIFSKRIEQLNVPLSNKDNGESLTSEIIQLKDIKSKEIKRTIWLRSFKKSAQVVYSGVYETCKLPSGPTCVKAVFPLPNGSATVILSPSVSNKGELILNSNGNKIGESGFYFLLKDAKEQYWAKFISSFKDSLVLKSTNGNITATQTLTLWNLKVLTFEYDISKQSTD